MSLIKWSPMIEPWSDFDKLLDLPANWGNLTNFTPAIDIWEDENNVYMETPLPGIDPDKMSISIENDILTIEGSQEKKTEIDEKNYYRNEVRSGSFHRAVALPASVKSDSASASYQNGILTVTVPKEEKAKPKKVKIDVKN